MERSKVYFTKEISPDALIKIYNALNCELKGKVCVKISTGEPGGHNFLNPKLIAPLVSKLSGTICECCTAYEGGRLTPENHWQAVKDHGFYDIAPCDIMDGEGEISIPVVGGKNLTENIIGKNFQNYDSLLILSHFKGHEMGGFGGALKNMSIGIASSAGKCHIHSNGATRLPSEVWKNTAPQDTFLECMADACKSIVDYIGKENIAYVSVANNLSIDCDCVAHPAEPEMADIGIFASLDPVALDTACYDTVKNSNDPKKASLIERMDSRHAMHTAVTAAELGIGTTMYEIVCID